MKPPYKITTNIMKMISDISHKIGMFDSISIKKPSPKLRKQNKIKTIHFSLKIEGNSLSEEQVSALIDNKRVIGSKKDILEVTNAIKVYDNLKNFNPFSKSSFLKAHKMLMSGLTEQSGKLRTHNVGVFKGKEIAHLAPPTGNVSKQIDDLFKYLKKSDELSLIKSSVFHYEIEFIHPFLDGNGRMGRLWQTLILINEYPIFEYIPFETLISKSQKKYYAALSKSDSQGESTVFIEYMLKIIDKSLEDLLNISSKKITVEERLEYFLAKNKDEFTRKDYMKVFNDISSATASRDIKKGIEQNIIVKLGDKNQSKYKIKK